MVNGEEVSRQHNDNSCTPTTAISSLPSFRDPLLLWADDLFMFGGLGSTPRRSIHKYLVEAPQQFLGPRRGPLTSWKGATREVLVLSHAAQLTLWLSRMVAVSKVPPAVGMRPMPQSGIGHNPLFLAALSYRFQFRQTEGRTNSSPPLARLDFWNPRSSLLCGSRPCALPLARAVV